MYEYYLVAFNKKTPINNSFLSGTKILGIDLLPESSSDSRKRFYAGYFENEKEQLLIEKMSLNQLIRFLWGRKVDYLAVDSISELGLGIKAIRKFLSNIPPSTKIIVVTQIDKKKTSTIQYLARQIDIKVTRKLSPIQTAQVVVGLAKKGIGSFLDAFEDEVVISISRPRSKGKGGWSQRRFERSLDEIVQQATRKIERVLRENDVDYDLYLEKSNYGLRTAKIIVYTNAEKVFEIVSPRDYFPAKIRITRKTKSSFSFVPLENNDVSIPVHKGRKLIVGIDPGLTVGIGIVDLDGRFVAVKSIKSATRSEILDFIMQYGTPLIICSDVSPMPKQVEKIAVISNALKYSPPNELSKTEKRRLTEGTSIKNAHEMDALAAAIKGYKAFRGKISKIFERVSSLPRTEKEIIVSMVLRGLPLEDAIILSRNIKSQMQEEKVLEKEKEEQRSIPLEQYLRVIKYLASIEQSIEYLQQYQTELLKENEKLRGQVEKLKKELRSRKSEEIIKTMTSDEIRLKTIRINSLEEEIEKMKRQVLEANRKVEEAKQMLWLRHYKNAIPVRVIPKFTNEEIEKAEKIYHIEEREVFFFEEVNGGGRSTAELMIMLNPKAIIYRKGEFTDIVKYELFKREIPVFKAPKTGFIWVGEIGVITKEALEAGIKKGKKEIAEFERQLTLERLEAILSEYRETRKEMKNIRERIKNIEE